MGWLKVNGCDFNLRVAAFSFEDFKREFQDSFCRKKSDEEIRAVWLQLRQGAGIVDDAGGAKIEVETAAEPELMGEEKSTEDGNTTGDKKKVSKLAGKRNGIGN